jgi:hypothetical protein
MELDITEFFESCNPADFSASAAELGKNAARITWQASLEEAENTHLLETPAQFDAFRDYMKGFGAWEDDEINGWTAEECNALLIQVISGDIRESCLDTSCPDWAEYEEGAEAGQYSGRICQGDDGKIYYYIGE